MELLFFEYILGQYLGQYHREKSDVISWVEEEHEIIQIKGSLNNPRPKNNPVLRN